MNTRAPLNSGRIDIDAMLKDLFRPRLVCICPSYTPVAIDYRYYGYKCSCGGWMSCKRIYELAS